MNRWVGKGTALAYPGEYGFSGFLPHRTHPCDERKARNKIRVGKNV